MQYGNGGKVKYAYDAYDRLTGVKHDGETANRYTYEYGADGEASIVRDNNLGRVLQTERDLAQRPMGTQLRDASGNLLYRTELDYDAQNRLVGFGETAGNTNYKTAYTYDNDNRVTGMTFDGGNAIGYTYDNLGRIATRTASPLTTTYGYVGGGYGTGSITPLIASIQQNGISFAYSYDSRGNITSETRNGLTTTYAYDALGQLIRVNDPHENKTWVYEYDRGGNMLKRIQYAYTEGALGSAVSTRAYSYASNWKDQLITNGPYPLTYDEIGNLRTYGGWEYEWMAGRRLVKQTQNEKVVSYEYDHNGMRIRQIVSNKTSGRLYATYNYTYNGSNLVHMTVYNDELHFFYDNQGRLAKVKYNGVTYTYLHNLQGDVVGILDSAGNLVVEYKYNAWGTILSKTGSMVGTLGHRNPFRYRGYIYDEETWMYWLKSRYYYPELHRFISADAHLGHAGILSHNAYAYCKNIPVICTDPNGRAPKWSEIWFAIRHPGIASAIGQVVEGKRNKNISTTAVRFSISLGLKQPESAQKEGTQVNAMRHSVWTGIISSRYGKEIAREAVRSHESSAMLKMGDRLITMSVEDIMNERFDTHIAADSACDILNNEIALQMDLDGMNGKEVCAKMLNTYHESGLWVISEINDGSGFGIYLECLGDDQYNTAVSMLAGLDEYGFSD